MFPNFGSKVPDNQEFQSMVHESVHVVEGTIYENSTAKLQREAALQVRQQNCMRLENKCNARLNIRLKKTTTLPSTLWLEKYVSDFSSKTQSSLSISCAKFWSDIVIDN